MASIFITNDEGTTVDLAAAARELRSAENMSNESARAKVFETVRTAALVDIAASLRAIAYGLDDNDPDDEEEATTDADPNVEPPLEVGDWVVDRETDSDPANSGPWQILAMDVREGAPVLDLGGGWLWASAFVKADPPELNVADDPTMHVESDIDSDFEGDEHPAAEAAVRKLTKLEKKTKKGKK